MQNKKSINNENLFNPTLKLAFSGFGIVLLSIFILLTSFGTIQYEKVEKAVESFRNAINLSGSKNENIIELEVNIQKNIEETDWYYMELNRKDKILAMKIETPIYFEEGSTKFRSDIMPLLKKIGSIVNKKQYKVHIKGYAENDKNIDSDQFRYLRISVERAVIVMRYLLEEMKIPKESLSAEGYGEFKSDDDYRKNENKVLKNFVEIILYKEP